MQFLVAAALIVVVAGVAALIRRRQRSDPPTQANWRVPAQLDRHDFDGDTDWLVIVFSSVTCGACADVSRKAAVLASREVTVIDVEYPGRRDLHERYGINAVPTLVIADRAGIVRANFVGPVTATDLWAAYAELREPGSSPEPDLGT